MIKEAQGIKCANKENFAAMITTEVLYMHLYGFLHVLICRDAGIVHK